MTRKKHELTIVEYILTDEKGFRHSKGAIQMPYGKVDFELLGRIAAWCGKQDA